MLKFRSGLDVLESKNYLYIQSFGCQMNLHDGRRMVEVLGSHGYQVTDQPEKASVILLNTCSIREKTQAKILSALGRYAGLKRKKPDLLLGVAGCVAQQEGAKLFAAAPFLDLVFGPDHIVELPRLIQEAQKAKKVQIGFVDANEYSFLRAIPRPGQEDPTALITIQKGCDNHCSYCIVPLVRGPTISRSADDIISEVRDLVDAGVKEVTLIGQNVNAYRGYQETGEDFIFLLRQLNQVAGLERIRFTTSHPKDFSDDLCLCFKELDHLCPWLHLPVQSGSSEILRRMKRGYSREDYLKIITRARQVCPDISIGTDFIVGFPGESVDHFQETMSLLEEIQFDYAYSFKYSMRPGTPAEQLEDDVPETEKSRRLHHLQSVQNKITQFRLSAMVGRTVPVLVEGPSRKGLPQVCGRTPGNHIVNFDIHRPEVPTGDVVQVSISEAGSHSLKGKIFQEGMEGT